MSVSASGEEAAAIAAALVRYAAASAPPGEPRGSSRWQEVARRESVAPNVPSPWRE